MSAWHKQECYVRYRGVGSPKVRMYANARQSVGLKACQPDSRLLVSRSDRQSCWKSLRRPATRQSRTPPNSGPPGKINKISNGPLIISNLPHLPLAATVTPDPITGSSPNDEIYYTEAIGPIIRNAHCDATFVADKGPSGRQNTYPQAHGG